MTEQEVQQLVDNSFKTVTEKMRAANALISEVKALMAHGTDNLSTVQIQEWAIALPIISQELTPYKEAYSLTRQLWEIELRYNSAKNLLEIDKKRTEIELINKVSGAAREKQNAVYEYMRNMLQGTQDSLVTLGYTLRKILDARIANREAK